MRVTIERINSDMCRLWIERTRVDGSKDKLWWSDYTSILDADEVKRAIEFGYNTGFADAAREFIAKVESSLKRPEEKSDYDMDTIIQETIDETIKEVLGDEGEDGSNE